MKKQLYKIDKDDSKYFFNIIKKTKKLKSYGDHMTEYIENTYYLNYNNNIVRYINHEQKYLFNNDFNKIIIYYKNLLEKYYNNNEKI
jgi:hypothetical protein